MTGEIGLDEGGILDALSKGGGKQVHESFEYNRKGLLIHKTTTSIEVTGAHIVFALMTAGVLILGPKALEWVKEKAPTSFLRGFLDPFGVFR